MKASPLIEAVNAGEFSPRMDTRVSFDKYPFGLSRGYNVVAMPQGGATFRPGTRFINEVKDSTKATAVYGLEPQAGRSYAIECGDLYIRFYRSQARLAAATTATVITNGTFNANITNWTDRSNGTAAISWDASGKMKFTGTDDGYTWCEQAITVAGGDQSTLHIFRFTLSGDPGATATVHVGTSSKGYELWRASGYGIGQHTVAVTPGTGTIYFQVVLKAKATLYLDDVSILSNTPLELTSPYASGVVGNIRIVQSNDVFYLFNDGYAVRKLERRGDYSWSLVSVFFNDGPWGEINPDIDLAAANLVKNSSFEGGLSPNWTSVVNNGSVEYDGSQGVVFLYLHANSSGQSAEIRQNITTGASGALHVMHFQAVGKGQLSVLVGTTAGGGEIFARQEYDPGWYTISFTPGVTSFYITFRSHTGVQSNEDVPGVGGVFIYTERSNMFKASATTGSVTVTARADFTPFAATDVGRQIRLEHAGREAGWGVVTAYTNNQTVTVQVYRQFASTEPTETWRLGAWSATTGYPACGIMFQQRLLGGHTTDQPQTFWASQSGDLENMRPDSWVEGAVTTEDNDAFAYTIAAKRGSPIYWFAGTRKLIVGTATGQWAIVSRGIALTPQDLAAEPHTSVRASNVDVAQIDEVALFVERDRASVDDLGYDYQIDGYRAADLSILSDHIGTTSPFRQIVYQSKPYSLVLARRLDGTMACLTYKREQNVVGWTVLEIAGSAASSAVIGSLAIVPGNAAQDSQVYDSQNRDELWMVVKRTIGGATKRYIEVQEGYFKGPNRAEYATQAAWRAAVLSAQADAFYVDCGITYSGVSTATITGLSHLNGETVYANVNGLAQGPFTVSSGQITLTTAGTKVQVGLLPTWKMRGLKMNYGAQSGTSVGQKKKVGPFTFVLLDSTSFNYGIETNSELGRDPVMYGATQHLSSGGALFTGEAAYDKPDADDDTDPRFVLSGQGPLPWTFLGMMAKTATNEV